MTAVAGVNREGQPVLNHKVWASDVSPSLMFAEAEVTRNAPRTSRGAETSAEQDMAMSWDTVAPGSGGPQMN